MIVSHAKKFIFIHNPKCSGTSFRAAVGQHHDEPSEFWGIQHSPYFMAPLDFAHLRLWEVAALYPQLVSKLQNYQSVVFVRNPYDRFASALHEHFRQYKPRIGFDHLPAQRRLEIAEDFIAGELTVNATLGDYRYVHFSPQNWFYALGARPAARGIIAVRPGGGHLRTACKILDLPAFNGEPLNSGGTAPQSLLQSKHITKFVESFYQADFTFFRQFPPTSDLTTPPRIYA